MEEQEAREIVTDLPSTAESVRRARRLVRDVGDGLPHEILEDAELLVSEVVSNAVQHGGPDVRLTLRAGPRSLAVRVYDGGDGVPTVRHTGPDVPSGRGLRMVDAVAAAWGVEVADDRPGKTVWFEVAVPLGRAG